MNLTCMDCNELVRSLLDELLVLLLPYDIFVENCVICDLIYVYMLVDVFCQLFVFRIQRKCCRKFKFYVVIMNRAKSLYV